jgi:hypothetical protein
MFTQLTDDLLDLVLTEIGRTGPRLAAYLDACCCCCCCKGPCGCDE